MAERLRAWWWIARHPVAALVIWRWLRDRADAEEGGE